MAAPAITNTTLSPGAGWQLLSSNTTTAFLRIDKTPHHTPIWVTWGASAPTGPVSGGHRIDGGHAFFQGAITGNLYGRLQNNSNGTVNVSVFSN